MTAGQREFYRRYGALLIGAGTLAATDLPMLESASRVRASLDDLYGDEQTSSATIAALERLHKEQLIQLGLTPAARRAVPRLGNATDGESQRVRDLLE